MGRLPEVSPLLLVVWLGCAVGCESPESQPTQANSPATPDRNRPATGLTWDDPIEVATGDAIAGPWRMNDSTFHYVDDPSLDIHDAGYDVVWVDNRDQQIRFRRYPVADDGSIAPPADASTVSRSPETFSWLPRVETDGTQHRRVYVLWQEIVFSGGTHGGEAFFARSTDGGDSFEPPVNLSDTQMGVGKGRLTDEIWHNGSLDLAVDDDGHILTAWTAYQGPLEFRRSLDGGETFSETITLSSDKSEPARAPSIATGPGDTVWIAWTVGESDTGDLRLAVSTDDGASFSKPTTILPSDGHSDAPKITTADNRLHLVYSEAPGGMFASYHIRYARSATLAADDITTGTLDSLFDHSRMISDDTGANFPSLASAPDNQRIYVVWNHYTGPDAPPRGLRLTVSPDGGDSFIDPSWVPQTRDDSLGINGSLQGMLTRKLDAHHNRLGIANSRFKRRQRSLIRLFPATLNW